MFCWHCVDNCMFLCSSRWGGGSIIVAVSCPILLISGFAYSTLRLLYCHHSLFFCSLLCPRLAYNKGCVLLPLFFVCFWFWINSFPILLFLLNWYSWVLSHTLPSLAYSTTYYLQILFSFSLLYVSIFLMRTNKASFSLEFSYYLSFLISRNSLYPHLHVRSHWYNKYYFWLCKGKGKGKAFPVQAYYRPRGFQ